MEPENNLKSLCQDIINKKVVTYEEKPVDRKSKFNDWYMKKTLMEWKSADFEYKNVKRHNLFQSKLFEDKQGVVGYDRVKTPFYIIVFLGGYFGSFVYIGYISEECIKRFVHDRLEMEKCTQTKQTFSCYLISVW